MRGLCSERTLLWLMLIGTAIAAWWQPWIATMFGVAAILLIDQRQVTFKRERDQRDRRALDLEQFDKRIMAMERSVEELRTANTQMISVMSGRNVRP